MSPVFLLIGYFLCGEQPESIRATLVECQTPTGVTKLTLEAAGIETNQLKAAQIEIFNSRNLVGHLPSVFSSARTCEVARAAAQEREDETDAYLRQSGRSLENVLHSQHWKCVETRVDEPPKK